MYSRYTWYLYRYLYHTIGIEKKTMARQNELFNSICNSVLVDSLELSYVYMYVWYVYTTDELMLIAFILRSTVCHAPGTRYTCPYGQRMYLYTYIYIYVPRIYTRIHTIFNIINNLKSPRAVNHARPPPRRLPAFRGRVRAYEPHSIATLKTRGV